MEKSHMKKLSSKYQIAFLFSTGPLFTVKEGSRGRTEYCIYHFNSSVEDCVKVCTAHMVLQCELPATVFGKVKSVKNKK